MTTPAAPHFFEAYWWFDGSAPQQVPSGWGLEFEVNLYNDESSVNHRPNCPFQYKEKFWAKNYDWNWSILRPDLQGASLSSLGAYADYNDLTDTCDRNSIAIGVRYPQNIQYVNGGYGILIDIDAPKGTRSSSEVGGNVQAIWDGYCTSAIGSLYSLTDCMGVYPGTWPLSVPQNRLTANISNHWVVPTKCWFSDDKGTVPAQVVDPCMWW